MAYTYGRYNNNWGYDFPDWSTNQEIQDIFDEYNKSYVSEEGTYPAHGGIYTYSF